MLHLTPRRVAAFAPALLALTVLASHQAPAFADDTADPFALSMKPNSQLLPTLRATERGGSPDVPREYDYTTKGYFKVGGKTVARLPTFSGHAEPTPERLTLTVNRSTRSTIRAAARRRGSARVALTLVSRVVLTTNIAGDQAPRTDTFTQEVFLRIPRG